MFDKTAKVIETIWRHCDVSIILGVMRVAGRVSRSGTLHWPDMVLQNLIIVLRI